jgi:hypothetical protein
MGKESGLYGQNFLPGLEPAVPQPPTQREPITSIEKKRFYTVAEGTTIYSGPPGGDKPYQALGQAAVNIVTHHIFTEKNNGLISHFVEGESPPEYKGHKFYVVQKPGYKNGFQ